MRDAARINAGTGGGSATLEDKARERWTMRVRTRNRKQGWKLYQAVRLLLRWLRWWVRLEVRGLENLPASGPILVVSNHDAWLDPLVILESMMWKSRQLRFLAKASLWKFEPFAWVLDGAGQIPIRRGEGDLAAIESAVDSLNDGEAIGILLSQEGRSFGPGVESQGLPSLARRRPLFWSRFRVEPI